MIRTDPQRLAMPLFIEEATTGELAAGLARKRGVSKRDGVRPAAKAKLDHLAEATALRERIAAWQKQYPIAPPTGQAAFLFASDEFPKNDIGGVL